MRDLLTQDPRIDIVLDISYLDGNQILSCGRANGNLRFSMKRFGVMDNNNRIIEMDIGLII